MRSVALSVVSVALAGSTVVACKQRGGSQLASEGSQQSGGDAARIAEVRDVNAPIHALDGKIPPNAGLSLRVHFPLDIAKTEKVGHFQDIVSVESVSYAGGKPGGSKDGDRCFLRLHYKADGKMAKKIPQGFRMIPESASTGWSPEKDGEGLELNVFFDSGKGDGTQGHIHCVTQLMPRGQYTPEAVGPWTWQRLSNVFNSQGGGQRLILEWLEQAPAPYPVNVAVTDGGTTDTQAKITEVVQTLSVNEALSGTRPCAQRIHKADGSPDTLELSYPQTCPQAQRVAAKDVVLRFTLKADGVGDIVMHDGQEIGLVLGLNKALWQLCSEEYEEKCAVTQDKAGKWHSLGLK